MRGFVTNSGGVDSSVLVALLERAVGGDRVVAVHIDHGLMRKRESEQVKQALAGVGVNLHVVDAAEMFSSACLPPPQGSGLPLSQVTSPEEKRHIIGDTFILAAELALKRTVP